VVGIGNIYANEALFLAGIRPQHAASRLSRPRCARLADAVKTILHAAIDAGGSTLRDFVDSSGHPGWFQQQHAVYGRANENCRNCGSLIRVDRASGRATYWCPHCQK
jgi:formamidopyrimidine-DNA glycosylase